MELKTYELEVEVKVRRTMRVKAPNPEAAKAVAWAFLSLTAEGPTQRHRRLGAHSSYYAATCCY